MAVYGSASVRINYSMRNVVNDQVINGNTTISARDDQSTLGSFGGGTTWDITLGAVTAGTRSNVNGDCLIVSRGSVIGAAYWPAGVGGGSPLSGSFFYVYTGDNSWLSDLKVYNSGYIDIISDNGLYYKDSSGDWHDCSNDNVVATSQQVQNLPSGVEFNGWLVDDEIIKGSDGNYYDTEGNQLFTNLPSGVIPVSQVVDGIFSGSDGNYYDDDGNQVLENLPSGVTPTSSPISGVIGGSDGNYYDEHGNQILENLPSGVSPVSQIGNSFVGSDGNYYDVHGDQMFENLPSGVEIVGYDDDTGNYLGSDGNYYDEDGNEVTSDSCDGDLVESGNLVRISIDGVDIFGNDFSYFEDVPIGQASINLGSASNFNPLKKINKIIVRNLVSGYSVGNSRLKIKGVVWGFRAAVDIDGLDPDVVVGSYTVCDCVFHTCDKYADVVLSSDIPLGLVPNTSTIDIGFYALAGSLSLEWDVDGLTVFPYCCGSVNEDEKTSGSTNDVNSSGDLDGVIESIDKLTEAVKELSMLVEVVVSPSEDVNIYRRRWHYNDGDDLNNLSGFSD